MCCTLDVLPLPRPPFPERRRTFRSFTKCTQFTYAAVILHGKIARCITCLQQRNAETLILTQLVRSRRLETPVKTPTGGPVGGHCLHPDHQQVETESGKRRTQHFSLSGHPVPSERTENKHLEQSLSPCHPPICHLPSLPIHSSPPMSMNDAWRGLAPPFDRALPNTPHASCPNMHAVWHGKPFEPKRKLLSDSDN